MTHHRKTSKSRMPQYLIKDSIIPVLIHKEGKRRFLLWGEMDKYQPHSGYIPFCRYKHHKGIIKKSEETSCIIKNCPLYLKIELPILIKNNHKLYIPKVKEREKILNF